MPITGCIWNWPRRKRITWRSSTVVPVTCSEVHWKTFQPIAGPPVCISLLYFHLVCHCFRCLRLRNFQDFEECANHIGSQQDEIVFSGKVWQQLKLQRKQNIHNAARLGRKWFPKTWRVFLHPPVISCRKTLQQKSLRWFSCLFQEISCNFFPSNLDCDYLGLGLWLFTVQAFLHVASLLHPDPQAVLGTMKLRWGSCLDSSSSNSLFRGFTARTMILPDWSDLCGHLWCSALQNSWPDRVRSGGSGCTSLKSSRFHGFCLCFHRSSDPVKPKTPSWHVLQWPPLQYGFTSAWTSGYGCFLHTTWYHVH